MIYQLFYWIFAQKSSLLRTVVKNSWISLAGHQVERTKNGLERGLLLAVTCSICQPKTR
jgi:hypothetical protein